jgi:hypothetical protein
MNAPAGPGLSHLPPQKPRDLWPRAILGQTLLNESVEQILDAICNNPSVALPFFRRRIPPFQPSCENFLRRYPSLMQGDPPIGADGVLA